MLSEMVFTRTCPRQRDQCWVCGFAEKKLGIICSLPLQVLSIQTGFLPLVFLLRAIKNEEQEGGVVGTAHFSILPHFTEKND